MRFFFILAFFPTLLISTSVFSANDTDWESKTYDLSNFSEISLEGGYKVYLTQGDKNSLTVKASDAEVFDYLKVKNDTHSLLLKIDRKHFDFERVVLYITFKSLEKINIHGGVRLETEGYLNLDDFYMDVEGGAKIKLRMKAEDVRIISEGGVLFDLNGIAKSLNVRISGAGHVNAEELKTEDVIFRIEGVGAGSVYATKTLDVKIEGVGKLKYRGNPRVTKDVEGLGSVTKD
ncbi:MAG: DUF2807 domain-containing protein [Prolixibacteraceae bacterium]|nr:DUF2807 domain-containing protein [Prolixibacteraceae bacterium]